MVTTGNGNITLSASSKGDPAGDLNLSTAGLSIANLNDAAKANNDDLLTVPDEAQNDAANDKQLLDSLSTAFKTQLGIMLADINTVSTPAKFRTSDSTQDVAHGDTVKLADGSVYRYLGGMPTEPPMKLI